jgi:hypothetical protein
MTTSKSTVFVDALPGETMLQAYRRLHPQPSERNAALLSHALEILLNGRLQVCATEWSVREPRRGPEPPEVSVATARFLLQALTRSVEAQEDPSLMGIIGLQGVSPTNLLRYDREELELIQKRLATCGRDETFVPPSSPEP